MPGNIVRVAAVQIDCQPGLVEVNLERAAHFVEQAARQGAQVVLLPELMPSGYLLTEAIWDCAETPAGPTETWLKRQARDWGIYLGTSYLEADGADFYNTFALATPEGTIAGRVRKSPPASLEAYFYRSGETPHVIETELGRIGVGICYENLLYRHLDELGQASVDLVLQPTAAGRPLPMKPGDIQIFDSMIKRVTIRYARVLGAPVVLANRTGPICTPMPGNLGEYKSSFCGLSQIVAGGGSVLARLGNPEGVILGEVQLGRGERVFSHPRCYGKMWALPMPWYAFIWPESQIMGERAYQENNRRKERALARSRQG